MLKTKPRLLAAAMAMLLALPLPTLGAEVQNYQNPPYEVTARKIEIIARSKNIPSVILKALAFAETGWRQFDKNGNVVTNAYGPRPSLGIMQVTSYNPEDTEVVNKLKYDIDYNIAYGADLLNAKWDSVPQIGNGDRNILENWYFALWAYNGWVAYNNPNNAARAGRIAYQDKIINLAASGYLSEGVVTPVQITPIPRELLPYGTLPNRSQTWATPQPYTLGDLRVGAGEDLSRGEPSGTITRIAGRDRIDTVNQIALAGWPSGANAVIIARADDFPDALAGVPLARLYNAPILITHQNELDKGVIDVLQKLKPLQATVLGGEGAISKEVEAELAEVLSWTDNIRRIAGENRFETAALIAQEFPRERAVALATGMDFPDALSLASAAASAEMPLLLTSSQELPEATKEAILELLPRGIYLAGGENAISADVAEQAGQLSGIAPEDIVRMYGSNRYETSVKIAGKFHPETGGLYLATGQNFTDPLAAGALAANKNSCLLLVSPQGLAIGSSAEKYISTLSHSTDVTVVGGEGIIDEDTIQQVRYLLRHF